jgi:transposase
MLKPNIESGIPKETIKVARAAFPMGNMYLSLRDTLGKIYEDKTFQELYPRLGQPVESPGRLALITVMQYVEDLSDRQAAEAVRSRIDWKYMLGLKLEDPGFDFSVLSEFRQRLVQGGVERLLLERLVERCAELGFLKGQKKQRTDSTHVLAAVRALSLLELMGEAMRRVLDEAARLAPDWLRQHLNEAWIKRYERRFEGYRLPTSQAKREELAVVIGEDRYSFLQVIHSEGCPAELQTSPKVEMLQRIWIQQYYWCEGKVFWRVKEKLGQPPAGDMITSPDDLEGRYARKRSLEWIGYKVHVTETCQEDAPRLITDVETTAATVHDSQVTSRIQERLATHGRLPDVHLVDQGYMDMDLLMESRNKGIDLVGPLPARTTWQDRVEGAFDHTQFQIDWSNRTVTCPNGKTSIHSYPGKTVRGTPNVTFIFDKKDCQPCPVRIHCSRAKTVGRVMTLYPHELYEAQQGARNRQETDAFKKLYAQRARIESTLSQGVRRTGLRSARYIGLARTHFQHIASAAAINFARLFDWLSGEGPRDSWVSPFLRLSLQT